MPLTDRRRALAYLVRAALALLIPAGACGAQPGALGAVQVTATRIPEPVETLPASVTVVDGAELRARGARDLGGALALVAGLDAPPGGDAGPAGSVPSLWGLREFDALLLIVDGVPWGGAFNPALPVLDLADVERIEVLKGAAPVSYGATAFVGVIQVIRYPAGAAAGEVRLAATSRDGGSAEISSALATLGDYRHSLVLDVESDRLAGRDQGFDRGHVLYRGAAPLGAGSATIDAEYTGQRQLPSSPVVRSGSALTARTALDANFNPADAGIGDARARLTLSYAAPTRLGSWHARVSYTRASVHDLRGFLRPELAIGVDGNNADGFNQQRTIDDVYVDGGLAREFTPTLSATAGLDWLYGRGTQQSRNFAYLAALDGSRVAPASGARPLDEINALDNRRNFAGLYAQLRWQAAERALLSGGLRLNRTTERQASAHLDTQDASGNLSALDARATTRASGALGASLRLWGAAAGDWRGTLFADYRNTFKPAAIDFGPDFTPAVLQPETAASWETGLRGVALAGRLEWEVALFELDFKNLVVHQTAPDGSAVLVNAGAERFRGAEGELRWRLAPAATLIASCAYHEARFGDTPAVEDGVPVQLDGRQLELSPHGLAALGLVIAPAQGLQASLQSSYVGRRYLDRLNSAPVGGFATLAAHLGYRRGRYTLALDGYNLSDRRDPVTASEFGDRSYYRLPARELRLSVDYRL